MDTLETRELKYFLAVAEELHFGRAAERLGMAQPPLSRAIQQLERRLGVRLLERNRRGVCLTGAGEVLLDEGRAALDAITAAPRRTRRAGGTDRPGGSRNRLVLAVKAAASHELLQKLLDAYAAEPDAAEIEVLPSGTCEQEEMLRDGRADVALMHTPYNSLTGFDSEQLLTEGQIAILPAGHPLAAHKTLSLADISDIPDLPLARWPRHGTYPPGPGPEIHDQTQLAQLIALGRTMAVFPDSARAWLWAEHTAVPLTDAPPIVTHIAWPPHSRSLTLAALIRTATRL
ncbi:MULTISPECIES: LysR family transcriptional regulator [Streptomyces]|uniref:LysR family transcriptional regulator n=1 Tax=Streptomyces rimosus subsp. rimosus (strain ATCC 10970 / DSM 40260 / JCM 4667 / NRRL 2234) TaxID=1265868 RepID=A0A8A1UMM6_STRR1|nr:MULTISPECIES: LysR family transcriptional regulator [Streptomyces]MYT41901.1 LysR family transcriptional regulator [Streptomyces sp. SID5471]QDA10128.1 LysR family transcriptional regulator [Streptomyces rimosus]QEV81403.1 LysR family transcriptional regulator [Streptomyces rimosus]QST79145.1 LysR family transcriptional regulator [Streptomyces rimosus subsp. rimosus ATCC 10970]QTL90957.1 LysR family transcriptional regulator [Streptomyces rimosus subsp. rimosus]